MLNCASYLIYLHAISMMVTTTRIGICWLDCFSPCVYVYIFVLFKQKHVWQTGFFLLGQKLCCSHWKCVEPKVYRVFCSRRPFLNATVTCASSHFLSYFSFSLPFVIVVLPCTHSWSPVFLLPFLLLHSVIRIIRTKASKTKNIWCHCGAVMIYR